MRTTCQAKPSAVSGGYVWSSANTTTQPTAMRSPLSPPVSQHAHAVNWVLCALHSTQRGEDTRPAPSRTIGLALHGCVPGHKTRHAAGETALLSFRKRLKESSLSKIAVSWRDNVCLLDTHLTLSDWICPKRSNIWPLCSYCLPTPYSPSVCCHSDGSLRVLCALVRLSTRVWPQGQLVWYTELP